MWNQTEKANGDSADARAPAHPSGPGRERAADASSNRRAVRAGAQGPGRGDTANTWGGSALDAKH